MKRLRRFLYTLEGKFTILFLVTSVFILLANILLFQSINQAIDRIDQVYSSNVLISDIQSSLADVQNQMTNYLSTNSTNALQNYYEAESSYQSQLDRLTVGGQDGEVYAVIEDINSLNENYLDACNDTLSAKRGRNVQRYRENYESATDLYNYLQSYLYSLNKLQLVSNSSNYVVLRQSFSSLEVSSFLILLIICLIDMSVCIILVRRTTAPMRDLVAEAQEIGKGNFDVPALTISEDEFGVVSRAFNEMVVSIRGYIQKLKESMELENQMKERELLSDAHLKEAQLKYLQAQINPHFLFNTLNAGAQLAMMEDADSTYRYLQNVAAFFRSKTNRDEQVTSLEKEIQLVDNYIYIINVRFSGSITYEKNIDDDLTDVSMPSMTLQPIIENAINHGIRDISWPAVITLSVYRTGDLITISVRDNGVGMSQEQIEEILSGKTHPRQKGDETNGVGLGNVVNRLRLFYDREDVFDITSAGKDKGTEVFLYLPMPK